MFSGHFLTGLLGFASGGVIGIALLLLGAFDKVPVISGMINKFVSDRKV